MKKIFLTGANGMLGTDFIKHFGKEFEIMSFDKQNGDITDINTIESIIKNKQPDLILNFAAYTNVEAAEDVGKKDNFDVNVLGVYNLAKISAKYEINLITISTDYVFDGVQKNGYNENDLQNPINEYGMAKYLGEKLSKKENPNAIVIRTSWLFGGGIEFKNFVNTMIKLSETKKTLKIIDNQFGSPTYTVDLCEAIIKVIENINNYKGKILHFSNHTDNNGITWFEFAQEIFSLIKKDVVCEKCTSDEFFTKAKRPEYSKLINNSEIVLRNWKEGLKKYLLV